MRELRVFPGERAAVLGQNTRGCSRRKFAKSTLPRTLASVFAEITQESENWNQERVLNIAAALHDSVTQTRQSHDSLREIFRSFLASIRVTRSLPRPPVESIASLTRRTPHQRTGTSGSQLPVSPAKSNIVFSSRFLLLLRCILFYV